MVVFNDGVSYQFDIGSIKLLQRNGDYVTIQIESGYLINITDKKQIAIVEKMFNDKESGVIK